MINRRGLLILIPLAAGLGLLFLLLFHPGSGPGPLPAKRDAAVPAPARAQSTEMAAPVAPPVSKKPASEEFLAKATDDARVKSTYQNFRTAVATGNLTLQDALRPIVLRDRKVAIRMAEEDMAQAPSDLDRDIARKTLDALRR